MSKPTEIAAEPRPPIRPLRSLEIHRRFIDPDRPSALTERSLYTQATDEYRTGRPIMDSQGEGSATGNQDHDPLLCTYPLSNANERSIEA
jgi:hypothetical protein